MTLLEKLKEFLKEDTRFVDSGGNLLKNKIVEHALKLDENLIKLLLKNDRIKQHFFKDIDDVLVFDKEKFIKLKDFVCSSRGSISVLSADITPK